MVNAIIGFVMPVRFTSVWYGRVSLALSLTPIIQGEASLTDEPPKPPKLNVTERAQHKVEKMGDGRFMAYWNGRVVYENGRIKRFATSDDALAFLASCDAVGRIIH
jgi:hypothetical protein